MLFGYFTLFVALVISAVAAYYSIVGLTAIFSAAVIPILIMGASLEVGKITAAVWLKLNWHRANITYKLYLVPAVAFLMLLTSMGIFGFLSKAHNDQNLVSGDVQSKIAVYDEKIKTQKENIEANRKALKQMDETVDQVLGRSTDEKGADKAVALRRTQQKERSRLQDEISQSQKSIAELNDARAPIAAEVRKVEAEVGPIKYIANFIYGDNPEANLLEKAVTWVIIIIVAVFDPLALVLILAAQQSIRWAREEQQEKKDLDKFMDDAAQELNNDPEWQQRTDELSDIFKDRPTDVDTEPVTLKSEPMKFKDPGEHPQDYDETAVPEPEPEKSLLEQHPYLTAGFPHFKDLTPIVSKKEEVKEPEPEKQEPVESNILAAGIDDIERPGDYITPPDEEDAEKAAIRAWKTANPDDTIKHQRSLYDVGKIDKLPWEDAAQAIGLEANNELPNGTMRGFGSQWPADPIKGDMYLRVDRLPSALYKYNGKSWIEIDKTLSDQYSYDTAYIDHLIDKIDSGEYDPDLLTEAEVEQIQHRFQTKQS